MHLRRFTVAASVAALALAGILFAAEPPTEPSDPAQEPAAEKAAQQQQEPAAQEAAQKDQKEPAAGQKQAPRTETKEGGLQITYVAEGSGARDGDTVAVLYTGKLQDGTVFDASEKHGNEPIEFVLGRRMVIQGWDQGLQGMQVGEKRTLVIPPDLGYGAQGAGGVIPPNATLTFEVELVGLRRPVQPQQ